MQFGLSLSDGIKETEAIKWLTLNPEQQEHWQKGEHSSLLGLSCWCDDFATSVFTLGINMALTSSAQGITLSAKTMIAIKKVKNFIECKGKCSNLLNTNQKL